MEGRTAEWGPHLSLVRSLWSLPAASCICAARDRARKKSPCERPHWACAPAAASHRPSCGTPGGGPGAEDVTVTVAVTVIVVGGVGAVGGWGGKRMGMCASSEPTLAGSTYIHAPALAKSCGQQWQREHVMNRQRGGLQAGI